MSERLAGKTAMVVGAGSSGPGWGNGKATAVLFAREGARVFCVDVSRSAADETADLIRSEGGVAEAWQADASDAGDVERAVAACVERFGTIDVLDNNVGIVEVGGVVELSQERWERILAVNLTSCFLAMKHVIPVMERNDGPQRGSIINISSVASLRYLGVPYVGYNATKAAMNQLTRATAVEYIGRGIRVNAILPGLMKTPMVERAGLADSYSAGEVEEMWRVRDAQCPAGHMGDAWDVAHAALFLASDESRYVAGVELVVDGGFTLKCA